MSRLILFASAALLVLAPPALAQGQGGDKGGGKGGGHAAHQGGKPDRGGGRAQRADTDRGGGRSAAMRAEPRREARGNERRLEAARGRQDVVRERNERSAMRQEARQRPDRGPQPSVAERRADMRSERADIRAERAQMRADRIDARQDRVRPNLDRVRLVERGRYVRPASLLPGCPPGLAKKDNGCLPPGQARKLIPNGNSNVYRYSSWYDDAVRDDWGYWNGYAYRVDPTTRLVAATVPLLGGALYRDAVWPEVYADYKPDPYYVRYFGYDDDYEYRYADGALFAVHPRTYEIEAVAALLAGDPWAIGRPMPIGYSVYNVPPAYRTRYYDGPEAWYRYSDGYVYRIDPATQLVLAAIALLA